MANESICIVEDDRDIADLVTFNLEKEGYGITVFTSGEEATEQIIRSLPDLVILDLMLPGVDGLEVCRKLKLNDKSRNIPIIMMTAKSEDSDIISGLEVGADDYVTKPFSPRILTARVRAVLRRKALRDVSEIPDIIRINKIRIDVPRHHTSCDGTTITLSATEFGILLLLTGNPGWVFSRRQIIAAVKGDDYPVTDRAVDVQILGLRKKLGVCGDMIETVRGYGYRLKDSAS